MGASLKPQPRESFPVVGLVVSSGCFPFEKEGLQIQIQTKPTKAFLNPTPHSKPATPPPSAPPFVARSAPRRPRSPRRSRRPQAPGPQRERDRSARGPKTIRPKGAKKDWKKEDEQKTRGKRIGPKITKRGPKTKKTSKKTKRAVLEQKRLGKKILDPKIVTQ